MEELTVQMSHEWMADGVLRVVVEGVAGIGSEGNANSGAMIRYIRDVEASKSPTGVMLDCSGLEYEAGNSIGAFVLAPHHRWGTKVRLCLLVSHDCAAAWSGLLDLMRGLLVDHDPSQLVRTDRAEALRLLGV